MKNFMVVNVQDNGRWPKGPLELMTHAQIDNSLELGWDKKDIIIMSNFKIDYMGVKSTMTDLNDHCLTGSKMFGVRELLKTVDDVIWAHDLDAWQNVWFYPPEFKDIGIACYSNTKLNGGSVFWKRSALDVVEKIVETIETNKESREEPTLNHILKQPEFKDRLTIIDHTYNVGCSGYAVRYEKALKPIHVCHMHPTNFIAWETHALDRSGMGTTLTPRLEKMIRKHYPNCATELSDKGKKRRKEKIKERKHGRS